jgi:hypothetical protein
MKLDYVKGTAYLPEGGGDYSLRGSFKPDWLPAFGHGGISPNCLMVCLWIFPCLVVPG